MIYWAVFSLGYFLGVFSALALFPPRVKEIEEQEKDAARPVLELQSENLGIRSQQDRQPVFTSEILSSN